jgi:hypothetical protein
MRATLYTTLFIFLFSWGQNVQAQYWRTFVNPLYKAHWKLNENEHLAAQKILQKRAATPDTLNPIYWHSKTRLAEYQKQPDSAIYFARKSVLTVQMLQKSTELYAEFLRIYILDAYYLDLYYRKHLYDKYNSQRSLTSPISNNELLGFYLQESQYIAPYLPLQNINRRITLPLITENLNALNDTIYFKRVIQSKNTAKAALYLKEMGFNTPGNSQLPKHVQSFCQQTQDSLFAWNYEKTSQSHTEAAYLQFIADNPEAPQVTQALSQADELAFSKCRNAHTALDYTHYLTQYPFGKYRKQAKMLLRYLTVVPVPFARADGQYVFVDSITMRPWIDSAFDFAYPFCLKHHKKWAANAATLISGCALVMKQDEFDRNQWYFIEKDGTPLNGKQYDEIRQISSTKALVSRADRHGLIDQYGRELLPPIFERLLFDTSNQIGMVHNGDAWALFNSYGKRISKFEFTEVSHNTNDQIAPTALVHFENNRIIVRKENTDMVLDFEGNLNFIGGFNSIEPFQYGISVATLPDKRQLFIDTNGTALSDTFLALLSWMPGAYYQATIPGKKITYGVVSIKNQGPQLLNFRSENAIEFAWYWSNPHFLTRTNTEWRIFNAQDSLVAQGKTMDVKGHAQTLFIQTLRKNPKNRNSPLIKKWYNPQKNGFSEISGEEIGVLQEERLVVYEDKKARLFHVNETAYPLFSETEPLKEAAEIREIFRINRQDLLMARTDSLVGIIDLNGRLRLPFTSGEIEEFDEINFIHANQGQRVLLNENNQVLLTDFEDLNDEGFEGYFLLKRHDRWMWSDKRKRLFGETP